MRPRPRHLLLLATCAALGWLVAPALSQERYLPAAVDFEQRLPDTRRIERAEVPRALAVRAEHRHEHGAATGSVVFRSPVIVAPKRFDLVGLARETRPLQLRAREAGGEWSRWATAANGDPVYFGGADELQVRAFGWRPRGRLHYVNVSGTTSAVGGLLTSVRRAVNSAYISASGLFGGVADAAPGKPRVIGRGAWGANGKGGCRPRERAEYGRVKAGVVHHTVSVNDYSPAEAPGIVLAICRYHRNGNGWNDIGYNALVDRFGNIYAGRAGGLGRPVIGAHAQGFNAQTTGVAMIGNHDAAPVRPKVRRSVVKWLAWKLAHHRVDGRGRTRLLSAGGAASRYPEGRRVRTYEVIGHGDVGRTACPGSRARRKLKKIRRQVARRIRNHGGVETPDEPAEPEQPEPGGGIEPR